MWVVLSFSHLFKLNTGLLENLTVMIHTKWRIESVSLLLDQVRARQQNMVNNDLIKNVHKPWIQENKVLLITEWQNQNKRITILIEPNRIKFCGMTETWQHSVDWQSQPRVLILTVHYYYSLWNRGMWFVVYQNTIEDYCYKLAQGSYRWSNSKLL